MVPPPPPPNLPVPYGLCEHLRPKDGLEELTWNVFQAAKDIYRGNKLTFACYADFQAGTNSNNRTGGGADSLYNVSKWAEDLAYFYNGEPLDIVILILMAALWTFARSTSERFFQPFAVKFGVLPKNVSKFTESAWKLSNGSLMWSTLAYVSFFRGHHVFDKSMELFADWKLREFPFDFKVVYFVEASYYMHAVYATCFLDRRRHDTTAMLIHHAVTLALIFSSYVMGYLKIGVLILVTNDASDVLLEVSKFASTLRTTQFGYSKAFDIASVVFAILFSISWLVLRCIFHLTKVWRGGSLGVFASFPYTPPPFFVYFNILLGALYALYVYWFTFILMMVYNLATGKIGLGGTARDLREYKKDHHDTVTTTSSSTVATNNDDNDNADDDKKQE